MKKQREIVADLTDQELVLNVYLTQVIMLVLALIIGYFVFDRWFDFGLLFKTNLKWMILVGGGVALVVVFTDLILERLLPKEWLDDGGINERVFRNLSIPQLFLLCAVVAFAEELLFRAVIQTAFGLVIASVIFALVHIRYLDKPILFFNVCLVSFLLGTLFYWTGMIMITIFAHFLIDFLLGIILRNRYKKNIEKEGGVRT
ncbi:CPBP family intramembrane glutamic endopeptidase [Halalkalibacter alkalisediminis]|uniref:Lysostaphin resistance A-like protein n=1 Tax=Halalkalibacter alkalisediminis TaxID=935616 RepID=A0ABV6NGD6_9BACI|nr:CPBP family intramembrane glutamic endopeptidase [Halalkalibacter alkalisediminis]